jgi:prepilin-type processing-associated H-X9-DG protein
MNNLKQIGIAMHQYAEQHTVLPFGILNYIGESLNRVPQHDDSVPSEGANRSSWMQQILPQLGYQTLYDQLPFEAPVASNDWAPLYGTPTWTVVPVLMCPSDPSGPKVVNYTGLAGHAQDGFSGNYVMCAGNAEFGVAAQGQVTGDGSGDDLNGIFYALSSTRLTDIADGLSNTVMGSELILVHDIPQPPLLRRDTHGRYYHALFGGALFSTQFPPNTRVPDELDTCNPHPRVPCNSGSQLPVIYARSYHQGGVNVLMADGQVRFVSDFIDVATFRAVGSRAGGESVAGF